MFSMHKRDIKRTPMYWKYLCNNCNWFLSSCNCDVISLVACVKNHFEVSTRDSSIFNTFLIKHRNRVEGINSYDNKYLDWMSSLNFHQYLFVILGLALATSLFDRNLISIFTLWWKMTIMILLQTWHRINVYTCEISTIKIVFNTYLSNFRISFMEKWKYFICTKINEIF